MRQYDIIKIWALILLVLGSWQLHAQDDNWDDEGEIEDAEVVIEKDRQIELPPASRSYEKVAPLPLQIDQREQSYNFERVPFESTQFTPNIRVLTIKEQPLPKLYGNYIKAGIGNYGTGYLEGYFNNKRSDTYVIGARLKSLASSRGPVAKENSASSDLTLGFDASYFTEGVTFTGQAEYERIKRFYYGVPTDVEPEKQIYNKVLVGLGLADSNKNPDIDYAFNATYTSFEDRFDVSEDQGSFDFSGTFKFNDQVTFAVNSDLHLTQFTSGGNSINRNFFRFTPTVHTTIDVFRLELGINVVYENDTIQNADKIHLSPVAKASYNISDNVVLYAAVTGDVRYQSWHNYVKENPFLGQDLALSHNIKKIEFGGGLKGKIWESVNFNTGFNIGAYENLAFYANSAADSSRLTILYDTESPAIAHLFGEIGYSKAQEFIINLRGELFGYDTEGVTDPWGRHTYSIGINGSYNVYQKLIVGGSITALGGIKGINLQSGTTRELDTIFDVNVKVDYLFSPRFSAFLIGKNLVSQKYERYLNYPVRGLTAIGGITYSF